MIIPQRDAIARRMSPVDVLEACLMHRIHAEKLELMAGVAARESHFKPCILIRINSFPFEHETETLVSAT